MGRNFIFRSSSQVNYYQNTFCQQNGSSSLLGKLRKINSVWEMVSPHQSFDNNIKIKNSTSVVSGKDIFVLFKNHMDSNKRYRLADLQDQIIYVQAQDNDQTQIFPLNMHSPSQGSYNPQQQSVSTVSVASFLPPGERRNLASRFLHSMSPEHVFRLVLDM